MEYGLLRGLGLPVLNALRVEDLTVGYGAGTVFSGLSLTIDPGRTLAVMGPSGSGKSSLLAAVTGLLVPRSGRVLIDGNEITRLDAGERAAYRRRHLGLVFQDPALLPELSVVENVALTLVFDGFRRRPARRMAGEALARVGLQSQDERRTDEVSGGEAQRVAIARALVRPEVALVVADEPTASLDARTAALVVDELLQTATLAGAAVLLATHDPAVAARCHETFDFGAFGR